MAHVRQSMPDSGHGFQLKVLKKMQAVPSWLGSGNESNAFSGFYLAQSVFKVVLRKSIPIQIRQLFL